MTEVAFSLYCKWGDLFGWDTIQETPTFPAVEITSSCGTKSLFCRKKKDTYSLFSSESKIPTPIIPLRAIH